MGLVLIVLIGVTFVGLLSSVWSFAVGLVGLLVWLLVRLQYKRTVAYGEQLEAESGAWLRAHGIERLPLPYDDL